MSHFITLVIVGKEDSTEQKVEELLAPFNEQLEVETRKVYMEGENLKRMAEHYGVKTTDLGVLALKLNDWDGNDGGVDDGGLFYYTNYNENSQWDWWTIGGRWEGFFKDISHYENEGLVSDYLKALKKDPENYKVFAFVTPDGKWHEKGKMGWFGFSADNKAQDKWDEEIIKALKPYEKGYRAIAVDCHI